MTFEELFRGYWWLIFPIFGMIWGFYGMVAGERRTNNVLDLMKSYIDQGKDPPPELMALASQQLRESADNTGEGKNSSAWNFVLFAALSTGFGVGYYMVRAEDYAFAFLIVTVIMGILALGSLGILIFGRK
jgi:hypothetical protein